MYMKLTPEETTEKIKNKEMRKRCLSVAFFYIFFLMLLVTIFCVVTHCHAWNSSSHDDNLKKANFRERRNRYKEIFEKYNDIDYWEAHQITISNHSSFSLLPQKKIDRTRIVCYYVVPSNGSWVKKLSPQSVDPYFCTHLIIGFVPVSDGKIVPPLTDLKAYKALIALKKINPALKILLSVEDFSSCGEFSKMVASEIMRRKFINSTFSFLNKTGFDGIDIDWEFPSWPNADLNQVRNYTFLLRDIRKHIDVCYKGKLLSVAVAAPALIMEQSYEIDQMAKFVDFVNVMSYDYHMYSKYLPLTGPNSPLYPKAADTGYMETLNTNWSAYHWSFSGMPKEKINVGIPTFGHSFKLINENNNGWNAPAQGFGDVGSGGFTTYPDACRFIADQKTSHFFDESYLVPYAFNGKEWVSYENLLSINLKAQYIEENGFGGVMIYSLNADDFSGECHQREFPLTREINNVIDKK